MASHIRRLSDGLLRRSPVKQNPQHYDTEESAEPITITLGHTELTYSATDREWRSTAGASADELREIVEKNKALEIENQMLKFKMNLMLDMLASSKLDILVLQNGGKK